MPEELLDPKQRMVELARSSRRPASREDMVPRPGSGAASGPVTGRLLAFTEKSWDPDAARRHAPSLDSAMRAIARLLKGE